MNQLQLLIFFIFKPTVDACLSIPLQKESINFLVSEPNDGMPNSISITVTVLCIYYHMYNYNITTFLFHSSSKLPKEVKVTF